MGMIVETADGQSYDPVTSGDPGHERPQARLDSVCDIGVRHERDNTTSIVPPGLPILTALFPAFRFAPCRAKYNRASGARSSTSVFGGWP
jgi:hypothetical protein